MNRISRVPMLFTFLMLACDKQPCTESGASVLLVPDTRSSVISAIHTEGGADCTVVEGDCDAGTCLTRDSQELIRIFEVHAAKQGQCTVIFEFSDGCAAERLNFTFSGPVDNCCENVCARGGGEELAAVCEQR